jgi:hypothetical protein
MIRALLLPLTAVMLLTACESEQDKVARAAAARASAVRLLGPNDLQIVSGDKSLILEIVGDSVHVVTRGSSIDVPATYIENVKYSDGRLRFDVKGVGLQIFDVGDGQGGAAFSAQDALLFVGTVLDRQNALERQP